MAEQKREQESRHYEDLRVSYGYGDWWRRLWMTITLGAPMLLGFVGSAPTKRAPLPGEFFYPSDLTFGWWKVALVVGAAAMILGGLGWRWMAKRSGPRPLRGAKLDIEEGAFVIRRGRSERRYDKRDVEHAFVSPEGWIMLRLRGGREISIRAGEDVREEILWALRPEPQDRATHVPIGPVADNYHGLKHAIGFVFALSLLVTAVMTAGLGSALVQGQGTSLTHWGVLLGGWLIAALAALAMRRRRVVIGTDGVRIDGALRSRFIPHAEVKSAEPAHESAVRLRRHRGLDVVIPAVPAGGDLLGRISDARALPRSEGEASLATTLERGDRSEQEWQQALRSLEEDRDYRKGALRIEDLERLVHNPGVAPSQRVAAAVVLAGNESRCQQIRIAAESSADRDLRAALEAAAEGEIASSKLNRAEKRYRVAEKRRAKAKAMDKEQGG